MSIFGKTINRFNHPKTGFEKAVSRAFFNNGNKVDKTRLRLVDGSPIASTGITRLKHSFNQRAVAIDLALAAASTCTSDISITLAFTLAADGAFAWEKFMDTILQVNFQNTCFNTKPGPDDKMHPAHETNTNLMKSGNLVIAGTFGIISLLSPLLIKDDNGFILTMTGLAVSAIGSALNRYTYFKNVEDGKWIIESDPPSPKKKELKEETSVQDVIAQFMPQPTLAPVQAQP